MDTPSVGFVYVLTNPNFLDKVKIGHTSRLVDDRISDLNTAVPDDFTAVLRLPTQNARGVEQRAHTLLAKHRVPNKEFFSVFPAQACETVREADRQINGIKSFDERINYIKKNERLFLPLTDQDFFFWLRFPNVLSPKAAIVDIWQAQSTGDVMELYGADRLSQVTGISDLDPNSTADPVPFLDRKATSPNGALIGKERLISGDRLLWLTTDEQGANCTSRIFEVRDYCQVTCRTWTPRSSPEGTLLRMNDMLTDPPPAAVPVVRKAIALPPPREFSLETGDHPLARTAGAQPPQPEYWMPRLGQPKYRQRRPGTGPAI